MSDTTQAETQAQVLEHFAELEKPVLSNGKYIFVGREDEAALRAGAAALRAQVEVVKPCLWVFSEGDGGWDGSCGASLVFENDGPVENKMKFCPNCGKPVAVR